MNPSYNFAREFLGELHSQQTAARRRSNSPGEPELPSYDTSTDDVARLLVSTSAPVGFQLGTGADIYTNTLIPAILSAKSEIILVTCFWAKSKTLSALGQALETLVTSRRELAERGHHHTIPPLRVRICFSSRSLFQKLFHTFSHDGHVYPPSSWHNTLGLPSAELLESGAIQLQVKTLFFLPFSVMHPKFVIIDRQRAFIPSCNISWEPWLEGCIEIQGPAIGGLLDFFRRTWKLDDLHDVQTHNSTLGPRPVTAPAAIISPAHLNRKLTVETIATVILPSSHHRNPRFRPFPWQTVATPPPTPLNVAVLQLIDQSTRNIYMQTPNLTSEPVICALVDALGRGVDISIVTNRNMMLLEQLVTAGTTTGWCLRSLVRRYQALFIDNGRSDVEAQQPGPGHLRICYFRSRQASTPPRTEVDLSEEPVHSHLKLTIVDDLYTILGSGNMDRASWYTSQELGILFQSNDFADAVISSVRSVTEGRLDIFFDSSRGVLT